MKKIARISSRLLLAAAVLCGAGILGAASFACTGEEGSSLGEGCTTHADCPNPARQRCVPEWGVCVGQTNELGELEDLDAGVD